MEMKTEPIQVTFEEDHMLHTAYKSHINLVFRTEFARYPLKIQRVLFIPTASVNLILVFHSAERGYSTKFMLEKCFIYEIGSDDVALSLKRTARCYTATATAAKVPVAGANVVHSSQDTYNSVLWHRSLEHLPSDGIRQGIWNGSWEDALQVRIVFY